MLRSLSLRFPPQATTLAKAITFTETLWQRPQVYGITIDGPTSRDLDDAIWIESVATGAIISIHIADVAEFVTPGTLLDKVAISRTTTRYFGESRNDPMLPRVLSENRLSLLEWQDRPTLTVRITLNQDCEIEHVEIFESWLASKKRFSYEEADEVLKDQNSPFQELLQTCYLWTGLLNRKRQASGAISGIVTPGSGAWIDEDGNLIVSSKKRYHANIVIQEFMILANRAVAQWLADADTPALYRNHTAKAIAPDREAMFQAILTMGSLAAIRKQLGNWLNRAEYGPTLIGHFALNLTAYCHFTSPIRRLADLINHRIVKARLHGKELPYSKTELEQLGQHIATVAREEEKRKDAHFKEERKRQHRETLKAPQDLDQLLEKDFSQLLKYSIKNEELELIANQVEARMNDNRLQVQDLYLLLFSSGHPKMQELTCEHLRTRVQDAASIIAMANDMEEDRSGFSYVDLEEPPFASWVEVEMAGKVLTTKEPAQQTRKQTARHYACLNWIEAYIAGALVAPEQRVQPVLSEPEKIEPMQKASKAQPMHPILQKTLKEGQNFVSMLNNLCQALKWSNPEYSFTETEEEFRCECQLEIVDVLVAGEGVASKKQRAKNLAARQVLELLQSKAKQG
ncbi:MAG: RNB domain-containing ribonuclease [Acaryochloridaceae cyanobacterium RU_4_10]|nr:RNB domain-containing ribonuclease [Acaryochloridaceae cyanobacterium RU_4_10]